MKPFKVPGFLASSNIYEVNTRQYTSEGTFKALTEHLPRLQQMGVEILWFMPVHPIGEINRKGTLGSYYSIRNFKEINPEFGSLTDFKAMIDQIHALGMRIIMDWVANHAAWDNVWTIHHPEYFERDQQGNFTSPYDWTDVIQIDHKNAAQQDAMIDAMSYWITECDIDGFRADLAHLTPLDFWIKARTHLAEIKPDLIWLAETEEPAYQNAFDISYTWKWMHATEEYVRSDFDLAKLKAVLHNSAVEFEDELRMYYTSNHDENSWNGTEYEKYGVYANALTVFAHTYKYAVPLIYSGQELPCRKRLSFFDKDHIPWDEKPALNTLYSQLLALRKRNPVFQSNNDLSFIEGPHGMLAFKRMNKDQAIMVFINLSRQGINEVVRLPEVEGIFANIFTNELINVDHRINVLLERGEYMVLERVNP